MDGIARLRDDGGGGLVAGGFDAEDAHATTVRRERGRAERPRGAVLPRRLRARRRGHDSATACTGVPATRAASADSYGARAMPRSVMMAVT